MQEFNVILFTFSIFVIYLNVINCQTNKQQAVDAAIKEARIQLSNEMYKETLLGGGIEMETHSYVKLTELTEKIGLNSNINLLAYEMLLKQGYAKELILQTLSKQRPDICTTKSLGGGKCDPIYPYRTINGTCNNLQNPLWGSLLAPFQRLLPNSYSDGYNQPKGGRIISNLPNSRHVSSTIFVDSDIPDSTITNFVPQFGQFIDHDLTLTPEGDKHCCSTQQDDTDCWSIPIYTNDSFYSNRKTPQICLDFTRSTPYCFPTSSGVREQMNILTAYLDASNLYGSDDKRSFQLRSFVNGRMRVNKHNPNLLPTVKEIEQDLGESITFMGDFLAGDERVNEMPALTVMHTLMVREHNRIADDIYKLAPLWTDEKIFQQTRRIMIAQWQNIVYNEYLPLILGNETMRLYGLSLPTNSNGYSTYDPYSDATIFHSFATAAYRFGHTLINGLVRLMRGLTQVGSYRVRDNFFISKEVTQGCGVGYDLILGGLMAQNSQKYDEFITEDVTNFVQRNNSNDFGSDLIARNIQRGRDHGLQSYNKYRVKICKLIPLTTWTNPPHEIRPNVWKQLSNLYNTPQDIDLFVGGISEYPKQGAVSGPTFNCLKAYQFQRIKNGDRFFFTHSNQPLPFTPTQLQMLRKRTLGDIICENSNIEIAPFNVFKTTVEKNSILNPRLKCDDPTRSKLDINSFI